MTKTAIFISALTSFCMLLSSQFIVFAAPNQEGPPPQKPLVCWQALILDPQDLRDTVQMRRVVKSQNDSREFRDPDDIRRLFRLSHSAVSFVDPAQMSRVLALLVDDSRPRILRFEAMMFVRALTEASLVSVIPLRVLLRLGPQETFGPTFNYAEVIQALIQALESAQDDVVLKAQAVLALGRILYLHEMGLSLEHVRRIVPVLVRVVQNERHLSLRLGAAYHLMLSAVSFWPEIEPLIESMQQQVGRHYHIRTLRHPVSLQNMNFQEVFEVFTDWREARRRDHRVRFENYWVSDDFIGSEYDNLLEEKVSAFLDLYEKQKKSRK